MWQWFLGLFKKESLATPLIKGNTSITPDPVPDKILAQDYSVKMDLSPAIKLIKEFEGLYLNAYLDPVGVPTIGYGSILHPNGKPVKLGDRITKEQAEAYLQNDIMKTRLPAIKSSVKVHLSNNELNALISFVYNVGVGAFRRSTMLRLLNQGVSRSVVAAQFDRWNRAGGRVFRGLTRRRQAEKALFLKSDPYNRLV